jgi:hypothetical protein
MSGTTEQLLASIRIKLQACADLYGKRNPTGILAEALRSDAALASTSEDLTLLRRLSKDTDEMLQSTLRGDALIEFAVELSRKGVSNEHIPKLPTVRRLRTILKNGAVKNSTQLALVRAALDNNTFGQLEPDELVRLGQIFDAHSHK